MLWNRPVYHLNKVTEFEFSGVVDMSTNALKDLPL